MVKKRPMEVNQANLLFVDINAPNGMVYTIYFQFHFISSGFIILNPERQLKFIFIFLADIYDEVSGGIKGLGLDTECLGGGRIEHFPDNKLLKVYGHSTVSVR